MEFIKEIAEIRKKKGWSQTQLAAIAGTTQQHVSLIERGRAKIELETLRRLLAALGYTIALVEAADIRESLAARQKKWEKISDLERLWLRSYSPAERLIRVGELADLFSSFHAPLSPDKESLRRQAEAIRHWRSLLSRIGGA